MRIKGLPDKGRRRLMNKEMPYIAVAPMMDWTDRHCRYFHRVISPHVRLYTEMVTTGALLHGDRERFLRFSPAEHPVALQLGGSNPADLATSARMGADHGYDEINLNCGCPSDRVQSGKFGACLMAEPKLVAECVAAMADAVKIPVTVKCRIGIDDCEEFSFLNSFIDEVSKAGCKTFIVHARKAWLKGLSPKENREIPPLRYDIVSEIKAKYPGLNFILNGGIKCIDEIQQNLAAFDGVMIGREAYQNPYLLAEAERIFFNNGNVLPREAAAEAMIPYAAEQERLYGTPLKTITRHMTGLFHGQRGGRKWRRALSEHQGISEALKIMKEPELMAA